MLYGACPQQAVFAYVPRCVAESKVNKGDTMQTKLKATPGPWAVDLGASRIDIYSSDAATLVATLHRSTFSPGIDNAARANAKLIAAAPDLLEFVQEWLDRQGTDENYMVAKARAALAKARGEQ